MGKRGLALFSPSGWAAIRAASEGGVDDETLSADFGVARSTIRKNRSRDNQKGDPWLTPANKTRAAEEEKMNRRLRCISNSTQDLPMTADQSIAQKMVKDGETASLHGMELILGLLKEAIGKPEGIKPLEDISDVVSATKAARNIAGLDKPELALQVNVGNMFPSE